MTDVADPIPLSRCRCPSCTARAALRLLETGRPLMARTLLREMIAAFETAEVLAAGEAARAAVRGSAGRKPVRHRTPAKRPRKPGKGAFWRVAAELREHVSRLGADRVAELLGVGLDDLGPLLDGRVEVAKGALERVRRAG